MAYQQDMRSPLHLDPYSILPVATLKISLEKSEKNSKWGRGGGFGTLPHDPLPPPPPSTQHQRALCSYDTPLSPSYPHPLIWY